MNGGPKLPNWLVIFNSISTTNLRIYFTLLVVGGTAIHYWGTNIAPASGWLYFLAGLSGIDMAHFASKRFSASEYQIAKNTTTASASADEAPAEDQDSEASTDIQELSTSKG